MLFSVKLFITLAIIGSLGLRVHAVDCGPNTLIIKTLKTCAENEPTCNCICDKGFNKNKDGLCLDKA